MAQTKTAKAFSIVYYSILFILFTLAGFNLLALRGVYLLAAFALSLLHLFSIKRIILRPIFFFVAAFSLSLAILYCRFTSFSLIQLLMIGILPIFAFLIGQSSSDKQVFADVFALAFGYLLAVVINVLVSLQRGAIIDSNGLNFYFDIQLHAESPRTFVSIDLIPLLALGAASFCLTTKRKWFLSIPFGILSIGGTLATNGFVGNRSFILVAPILLIVLLLYFGFKASTAKKKVVSWSLFIAFLLFTGISYFGLNHNLFGIRDFVEQIPAIARFADRTGSGRQQHYEVFFTQWLNYPRGGMFIENLFMNDEIHNAFLQVYSIGGWFPFVLEGLLLLFWIYLVFAIKITKTNRVGIITSVSFSIAFFAICLFEPMITSEPFICSTFFLCAGYLYGEWARQRNRKPLLSIGLSHNGGPSPSRVELFGKLTITLGLMASTTVLTVFSDYGEVFSVIGLLLFVLGFVLIDKGEYDVPSAVKTIACLIIAAAFTVFLNIYLSTNTWMYALAKSALSIAVFIFLRIIVVSKNEEKDGYCRLRNFFTKLARDIDGSPEENLVSQDLQTNN